MSGAKGIVTFARIVVPLVAPALVTCWLFVFLLKPVEKKKMLASTSAQFAEAVGGTRNARMGA